MATDRAATLAALRARLARIQGGGRTAPTRCRWPSRSTLRCRAARACPGVLRMRSLPPRAIAGPPSALPPCWRPVPVPARSPRRPSGSSRSRRSGRPARCASGMRPETLVVVAASGVDSLWAAEEALRCPAVGAACLVHPKPLDLPASRRLQLAAEAGGGIGLVLVRPEALAQPSAARTRWRISSAPGTGVRDYDAGPSGLAA